VGQEEGGGARRRGVFQPIGLDKAGIYVKSLLNLIEYPPRSYEGIVAVVATSEGVTRREIGRHRWGRLMLMWNMPREGFQRLYEKLPGPKPPFEDVWRWTGGNPSVLAALYENRWTWDDAVEGLHRAEGGCVLHKVVNAYGGGLGLRRLWSDPEARCSVGEPDGLLNKLAGGEEVA
jgi:hypothetical protein